MPNYKIKITPLQYYFFGGEKHNEEFETNYFVESLDYPQQTTILGMLRYFLLQKNGLLNGKNSEAAKKDNKIELIGEQSFEYSYDREFGRIKQISPLYFTNNKTDYFFAPIDINFKLNDDFILLYGENKFNSKDLKKYIKQYLINNTNNLVELDSIIKSIKQVGNEKGEKGATKENAFYKQTQKILDAGWSFAVDATIEITDLKGEYFIPFGAEKNIFKIEISNIETFTKITINQAYYTRNKPYILCCSDCFIDGNLIKSLPFAVNDFISFRNFRSSINTKNYYAFKKEQDINNGIIRSSRYQLLKRGSVLYFNNEEDKNEMIENITNQTCTKIGFNTILTNQNN